jgi:chaperonin cofactor prefoldin
MKVNRVLCFCMITALATLAAEKPPVSNQGLGQVEAILEHCAKINPQAAQKYKDFGKLLVGKASDKDVEEVRKSGEYKEAHDSVSNGLEQALKDKASKDQAIKACNEFLQTKK